MQIMPIRGAAKFRLGEIHWMTELEASLSTSVNFHPKEEIATNQWPPTFTLDQERILNLLTGDRFYTNASAALREAVLNAIDAVQRRQVSENSLNPCITVNFDRGNFTLEVSDNGDGMDRRAITDLFTRVGASAAKLNVGKGLVGEFGIGVISYFMAGDSFSIQTYDGSTEPIGLRFTREMLAGGAAESIPPTREARGTTLHITIRDEKTFELLLNSYPQWCRGVSGLVGFVRPGDRELPQAGPNPAEAVEGLPTPSWVERAHLSPVSGPSGWDSMSGESTISVLYRGVFVQEFTVRGLWGIQGSIDVDPKHFKPRLNREGFVEGAFQAEVEQFLRESHPKILNRMAARLSDALREGALDKWTQRRWATLWLSIPRGEAYAETAKAWDTIFRRIPAFELAVGNKWEPISLERLLTMEGSIYVAPLPDETQKQTDIINAALRLLRHTGRNVIRGLRPDRSWLRHAGNSFGTTADLITAVFANELPELLELAKHAESVVAQVKPVATLFGGNPSFEIVRIGNESPPVIRLKSQLIVNIDHPNGRAIIDEVLTENTGPWSLIAITARHSYEHISQVAAAVRESSIGPMVLGLVKRRYIRGLLS
jgi:hypothetical protein